VSRLPPAPSIQRRLGRALMLWSAVWALAVAAAVWQQADHEVDELLDDTLQTASQSLLPLLSAFPAAGAASRPAPAAADASSAANGDRDNNFAWQVVDRRGQVMARSDRAPAMPLHAAPQAGFSTVQDWRVFGHAMGSDGRMLYVAQTRAERVEAEGEVALSAALATLAVSLLGLLWLRARLRHELRPLQALSQRLEALDPSQAEVSLGPAERRELQPVHDALEGLGQRLARRVAHERAFAGHAAHALRTPLAAMDTQLAVAQREAPEALRERLQRVRDATGRLQRVVAALLALFRSGVSLQRQRLDVAAVLSRLPVEGLALDVEPGLQVDADPDLLAAALLNLLDNALRVGARQVRISQACPGCLRLHDDGPGMLPERRLALQRALDEQAYEGRTGLGLMLADMVAREHGGALRLPAVDRGFAAELCLAAVEESAPA
jgi:signal transduction histidine kinase